MSSKKNVEEGSITAISQLNHSDEWLSFWEIEIWREFGKIGIFCIISTSRCLILSIYGSNVLVVFLKYIYYIAFCSTAVKRYLEIIHLRPNLNSIDVLS
ncbi:hypothetical protein QQG55_32945 [Brugia pahangi]